MRWARVWGCAAALMATCSAQATADRAAFMQLGSRVLQVEAVREAGGLSLGSGVVVAAQRVVTNCHVTRGSGEIFVVWGAVRWRVVAQAADTAHDLCLLDVPELPSTPVTFAPTSDLPAGQSVTALGFTGGIGIQLSPGEVVAAYRYDDAHVIQSTNWFTSGASGGGLFDDEQRLVGVLTFRLRGGAAHYFSAPVEWVQRLVQDRQALRPVRPRLVGPDGYWERPVAEQPTFLRAVALERDGRWSELESLAEDWSRRDAGDPQPWYLSGRALVELDRLGEARAALERCLTVEPRYPAGWFQLGRLWARLGQTDRAREALARLQPLHPELATALGKLIGGS